jgi:DNA-directed RNA polymerase subunit L
MEKLRNEVTIELAGETRTMRASFSALMDIERDLKKSLISLINQAANTGDISVTEAAYIIHHGLRGHKDTRLSFAQVGDAVMEAGLASVLEPVVSFLGVALSGVSVGKPKEPETAQ